VLADCAAGSLYVLLAGSTGVEVVNGWPDLLDLHSFTLERLP